MYMDNISIPNIKRNIKYCTLGTELRIYVCCVRARVANVLLYR